MKWPPAIWVCAQTCVHLNVDLMCPCLRACACACACISELSCAYILAFFGYVCMWECVCVCMCAYKSVIPQSPNQMSPKPRCHSSRWQPNES